MQTQGTHLLSANAERPVSHVSDTALWVAVHRAKESKRKDALFRDPYAERLAGDRGREIVHRLEQGTSSAWSIITRTAVLDELIMDAVRDGVDTILNLAAGLDTRPYRLPLPASTRWVEVDFPEMIAYKEGKLADARPRCSLQRIALDLTDRAARQQLFARLNEESRQLLVITEGLLVYLTADEVSALAEDLHAMPHFRRWIADAFRAAWWNCLFRALRLARPHGTQDIGRKPAPQAANAPGVALPTPRLAVAQTRAGAIRQIRGVSLWARARGDAQWKSRERVISCPSRGVRSINRWAMTCMTPSCR
jgi:methyltransferase (TIGR00027 family)